VIRHLGFEIPLYVTQLQGRRLRAAGSGVCSECLKPKHRVYLADDPGNGRPICSDCVEIIYADKGHGLGGQAHPEEIPVEVVYSHLAKAGLTDDFDTAFWDRQVK
jgi:hypothetical protein